jgi:hypothetical protein
MSSRRVIWDGRSTLSTFSCWTFPGFVYQLGNLIASVNATLQAGIAVHYGGDYAVALAAVAGTVAVAIVILTALGPEAKGVAFGTGRPGQQTQSWYGGKSRSVTAPP